MQAGNESERVRKAVSYTHGHTPDPRWEVDSDTGCWNWTGPTNRGYGRATFAGVKMNAHRAVWLALRGPIPPGRHIHLDHLCRNKMCVNPDHMEVVSRRENILRGESPYAKFARQTHCAHGHEMTPENTMIRADGHRRCRECGRAATQRYRDRKALTCSRCGRVMPYLESSISSGGKTANLCHPDDPDLPDCYSVWSQIDAELGGAS